MPTPYAELHCLSNFSFGWGASHAEELARRAAELGYQALAITDECSLAGIVRAHQAAQAFGIKLIVGARVRIENGPTLVLLAPDREAYEQLSTLITRGRRAAPKGDYRLQAADCDSLNRCLALWIPGSGSNPEQARWITARVRQAWLAVALHRGPNDRAVLRRSLDLARRSGLVCVAASGALMHSAERKPLLDVIHATRLARRVADCGLELCANGEAHLRSREVLAQLYPEELLAESAAIAERCGFSLAELRYDYPQELVPQGHTATTWLSELTRIGIRERWPDGCPASVLKQIDQELALIAELAYEPFFLTVHDIVQFARGRGILCQGRGSAANSAVCFAIGITAVDPARSNLLFERFLSRERAEPPDIDVDFEHQRREEVIQYVFAKYGRERAALAATVICYRKRSALRDVGRALGFEEDDLNRLTRSLAWWDKTEELPARLSAQGFDPAMPAIQLWLRLTRELVGFPRHLSQHVGGFVISEQPLSRLVPIENAAMPERTIIQWDKDDLEALGLLKVDVLALGMLSAIRRALDLINRYRGTALDLASIPAEDPATYEMISRAETVGVFQIESRAQQNMLPRLQPRTFYDLVIEVAIVRPGPIVGGMVHPYLKRRSGQEPIDYPPQLERVLKRTYGVPIFQEQVMEIAIVAARFTPGEADQMRRSMAAWKRSGGLEKFRGRLVGGMLANGYEEAFAEQVYQRILGFGSYGFPESHAASFALLAYASSWLKCHEPAAFTCALLNSQPMGFYPPSMLVREAQRVGVEVRVVDVARSDWACTCEPGPDGEPAIRLGLLQVSGLDEPSGRRIEQARTVAPFRSIADLAERADLTRRALNVLADAGALASLAGHRHAARWAVAAHKPALPLAVPATDSAQLSLRLPGLGEEVMADYQSLGLSLREHPVALFRSRLAARKVLTCLAISERSDRSRVRVAGLVMFRQRPGSAKGVMFMTLEDETGTVNLILNPQFTENHREVVLGTRFTIAEGRLQRTGSIIHISVSQLTDLSAWVADLPYLSRDFH